MKAYIFQPPYSRDLTLSDAYFRYELKLLDECGEDADIILLPEYSDVPCAAATRELMERISAQMEESHD